MKFCGRLLSILRVSRDYLTGRQKPNQGKAEDRRNVPQFFERMEIGERPVRSSSPIAFPADLCRRFPRKAASRNKMTFCGRPLSLLRVSRDYLTGTQKPTQMPTSEAIGFA